MEKELLSKKIRNLAGSIGIDALGFAGASEFTDYALNHSRRRDPILSLPDAKTIIVAGIYIGGLTLPAWTNPWYGRTSRLYSSIKTCRNKSRFRLARQAFFAFIKKVWNVFSAWGNFGDRPISSPPPNF